MCKLDRKSEIGRREFMSVKNEALDLQWLRKYSRPGPRYTSYPTAPVFNNDFTDVDYQKLLSKPEQKDVPLSLYFHIPFCKSVCSFCACSVIYTKKREQVDPYIEILLKEMDLVKSHLDPGRKVNQLHWGGGSPTFMTPDRMAHFMDEIRSRFSIADDAEISIELDPRETSMEHLDVLAGNGFNRASLGIQDVDDTVQRAVNRVQPMEIILPIYEKLKALNFSGINLDLIYGLPHQTPDTFRKTIETVVDMRPARISLFNFAYLPHLKTHQKRIDEHALPDVDQRLEIFADAVNAFVEAGYTYIGMDHFALPEDELSRAQSNGTLHRNFQGYTTRGGSDLLGLGVTSIGELAGGYAQNRKDLSAYTADIEAGRLPIERGLVRSADDQIRHHVIMELINHFHLDFQSVENKFDIRFNEYFGPELPQLEEFKTDGLLELDDKGIRISWQGRFVVRNICMVFDAHLAELSKKGQKFSRTV